MNGKPVWFERIGDQAGSMMLEVLVALFLFGLAMLGLAQLGYASMVGNKTSQSMMDATALCQDRLEKAKQLGFEGVNSLGGVETYGTIPKFPAYKRITQIDSIKSVDVKEIEVAVFWGNNAHRFSLKTAIARK